MRKYTAKRTELEKSINLIIIFVFIHKNNTILMINNNNNNNNNNNSLYGRFDCKFGASI